MPKEGQPNRAERRRSEREALKPQQLGQPVLAMATETGTIALPLPKPISPDTDTRGKPTRQRKPQETKGRRILRNIGFSVLGVVAIAEIAGALYVEYDDPKPTSVHTILDEDLQWPLDLAFSKLRPAKPEPISHPISISSPDDGNTNTAIESPAKKPETISSAFDPKADKGTIGIGDNLIPAMPDVIREAYREQLEKNTKGPTVVFPVKFTAPRQTIDYEYQKPFSPGKDSLTGEPVTFERPGSIKVLLNKGQEIIIPAENAQIFQLKPSTIDDQKYFAGFFIKWEQDGEIYTLNIVGVDARTLKPLGDAVNAPVVTDLKQAENGLKLPFGTPVAIVDFERFYDDPYNVHLNFNKFNPETQRRKSIRPNFVTDDSDGQTKLLSPSELPNS